MKSSTKAVVAAVWFLGLHLFPLSVLAATATDSTEIDPETIKENIKRRIEQVVKTQKTETQKKTAFLGTLNSVTTNSFSIQTPEGEVKQASNAAFIAVVELPKSKEIKFEDISIGDYIAALGYLNETTKVLDVRRILVLRNPPEASPRKTAYGIITSIDAKKNVMKMKSPKSSDELSFKISAKTSIQVTADGIRKQSIELKSIPINSQTIVIYTPPKSTTDNSVATSVLIKSTAVFPSPSASPIASPSPSPKSKS